jgi:hypothetical protein
MGAKVEADRDLFFGILALQNGLIEQADLIAAFQRWTKEPSCPMARILVERGTMSQEERTMVDGLVRRHLEKLGGETMRDAAPGPLGRLPLIDDNAPAQPGSMTMGIGSLLDPEAAADPGFTLGQSTSEGGRFQLLRRHARGGIGMVFVALDSELHREVALKQIQTQHADDPTSRARFLLEAEVTGRLEHPGVVPVYGLGSNEQGPAPRPGRTDSGAPAAPAAVHRRLQCDRLRPQPGRDPPRPEAGQYPAGPVW